MKKLALVVAFLAAGCASGGSDQRTPPKVSADDRLAEIQTSMTELLERLDVMNARIERLESAASEQSSTRASAPRTQQPAVTQQSPPVQQSQSPVAAAQQRAVLGASIAEQYRNAIVLFGKNSFPEARAAFQKVFDADPSGELADNALFWIGESYYAAGDFPNAMSMYRRVSEEFGDQNKAPDALYKLALTYEKSGDLALARKALQDVIARYPYSSPAASAKAELNRIKY